MRKRDFNLQQFSKCRNLINETGHESIAFSVLQSLMHDTTQKRNWFLNEYNEKWVNQHLSYFAFQDNSVLAMQKTLNRLTVFTYNETKQQWEAKAQLW